MFRLDPERPAINDPVFGWTGPEGMVVRWGSEGWGVNRYAAAGEIETARSGGRPIAVLGDSHAEAFQVNKDDNFASVADVAMDRWHRHGMDLLASTRRCGFGAAGRVRTALFSADSTDVAEGSPLLPAFLLFAALAAILFTPVQSSPFIYFRF